MKILLTPLEQITLDNSQPSFPYTSLQYHTGPIFELDIPN